VRSREEYDKEDIVGMECKHSLYTKGIPRDRGMTPDDLIFVKEIVHLKGGRKIPQVRSLINYKRPFWITRPNFRKHQQKKEWESVDKLQRYECTQAELTKAIKKALNDRSPSYSLKQICRNPYVYGADITSTAIVKRHYMDRWPDARSENSVAVLDIETDVVMGTEEPIYVAVTFKDRAILAATKEYVDRFDTLKGSFEEKMKAYFYNRFDPASYPEGHPDIEIATQIKKRNVNLEVVVVPGPLQAIKACIDKCHEWMPDFLAIWNMNFDIPKILETIERYGGDAGDIFSDPSVPKGFRTAWYKEGASKKVTVSGKEEPLHWVDRWHTLHVPASFYVIDQACVFRKIRFAGGREPSYALDAILGKFTNIKKLKNDKADKLSGLSWHVYMQKHEPLEYGAYNLVDCISCEILDEQPKVGDLRVSISMQCGHSDYDKFPSQPRRTVDDLHYFCLEKGLVIGTTSDNLKLDFDNKTISTKEWIITLPAHLVVDNGIRCIEELENNRSLIRVAVYD
jgi:hypothetical protein